MASSAYQRSTTTNRGEALYRALYEESPIAIELYDTDGLLVSVNPACLELFGVLNEKELAGFDLFADPNIADAQKQQLRHGESVRYSAPFDFEAVKRLGLYRTSRSGVVWLDVQIAPLNAEGVGYLAQVRDVTIQREAQEEIRLAKARLEAMLNALPDLMFRASRDGQVPMSGVSPSSGWSRHQAAGSALTSTTGSASAALASTAASDSSERYLRPTSHSSFCSMSSAPARRTRAASLG